jgi:co-chaperonin GroES (HSP10)
VNEGPVVASPFKYDTGVEVGDTLYFHHLVVMNEGQPLTGEDKHFLVRYSEESALSNQAIAYKSNKTGEVKPLHGWAILEEIRAEKENISETQSGLVTVELKEKNTTKAKLAFESEETKRMGLELGDIIGFQKDIDYRFKIDGKEYIRIPEDRLLYVEV